MTEILFEKGLSKTPWVESGFVFGRPGDNPRNYTVHPGGPSSQYVREERVTCLGVRTEGLCVYDCGDGWRMRRNSRVEFTVTKSFRKGLVGKGR